MAPLTRILGDLKRQREQVRTELDRLDRAIQALSEVSGRASRAGVSMRARHMSKAARKRIADAQRARWARVKAQKAGKSRAALPKPPALVGA
jgi:DNA-binding transcriptional regulator PaaX